MRSVTLMHGTMGGMLGTVKGVLGRGMLGRGMLRRGMLGRGKLGSGILGGERHV